MTSTAEEKRTREFSAASSSFLPLKSEFQGKDFSITNTEIVVSALQGGFVEEMKQQSLLCKETPVRSVSWRARTGINKKERKREKGKRNQEGKEKKENKRKKKYSQKHLKLHSQR